MTPAEARGLEARWGGELVVPVAEWRCCMRCRDAHPPAPQYWCDPGKRLCRACKHDERRGIWPLTPRWHRKNRWTVDGHLVRRCAVCRTWQPLTTYYLVHKHDKRRSVTAYPYAVCTPCARVHKRYPSLPAQRAAVRAQRGADPTSARRPAA